ncbi:TRAP transporter small permease [Reyranella sp.]|jgi:TRAP-type C4-dicarboxylate transport system permease small subunit|uniref:TRAP transporter small permease n=1 Tax=Reyranella sp. TaxID=1929291 RepID=UPI002F928A97
MTFIARIPKIVVALLLIAAITNLLVGVFLRYVMIPVTDSLDLDPIPFTWVEEVGEMLLAYLTLIGAAIGVRERAHFTLHVLKLTPRGFLLVDRVHFVLVTALGLLIAWFGVRLCILNSTLTTPGLQINLAVLYGAAVVGGLLLAVYAVSMIVAPTRPTADLLH